MALKLNQLLVEQFLGSTYGLTGIIIAIIIFAWLSRRRSLDAFPAVGCDGLLGSWSAGFGFLANAIDLIQEGYEKHKSAPFKIADPYRWIVILSKREHLEELQRAPDDQLSSIEAVTDAVATRYTLGDEIHDNHIHVFGVIRSQVTRNVETMCPDIRDEVVLAFEDVLDLTGEEWKCVSVSDAMEKVICRSMNRLLFGLPLCRDPDWINLNKQSAMNVLKEGLAIGVFPKFLRPLASRFFTTVARDAMRAEKRLGPIIEERLKHLNDRGNKSAEKPNDLISWLIEDANAPQLTVKSLTTRVLAVLFISINPTSINFTPALFYLAANPQYIKPLREEVEAVVAQEGWTKTALGKMRKIDSFLKECQRVTGAFAVNIMRKAMKDFSFSDGTFIPKGTMIGVASRCLHLDEKFYKDAHVFKPFRFADIQEEDGEGAGSNYLVSISFDYHAFGHGRHACAGRFVAATIMKTMLAHIVTTYDLGLEEGTVQPCTTRFGICVLPSPSAKLLFRRRVD